VIAIQPVYWRVDRIYRKHSFLYFCVIDRVYRAVAWQRVRYSILRLLIQGLETTLGTTEQRPRLQIKGHADSSRDVSFNAVQVAISSISGTNYARYRNFPDIRTLHRMLYLTAS
jgi:hypothetical protein